MDKNNNIKNITVEYYKVLSYVKSNDLKNTMVLSTCEISNSLKKLQEQKVNERCLTYKGELVILTTIEYNKDTKLWELVFFKGRASNLPFIVNKNGDLRDLSLNSDEMLSEVLCVLYNPDTKTIALQRNIYAFNVKCLEEFINLHSKYHLILEPIQSLTDEKRKILKKSVLKKFKLRVYNPVSKIGDGSDNKPKLYKKDTSICKAIDAALAMNTSVINIEFSVSNSCKAIHMEDADLEVFEDLMNNNNVKSLEVGVAADEYSVMQITDFMDTRIHDTIAVPFIKGKQIDVLEILKKMTEKFKENLYLLEEDK